MKNDPKDTMIKNLIEALRLYEEEAIKHNAK